MVLLPPNTMPQDCCNPESITLCEGLQGICRGEAKPAGIRRSPSLPRYRHFLLEAPEHLLQLQLVLAVELRLVSVLLLLKETQLPQLLAPAGD